MKSGRLTIAWYRNRPSPTTPGWLRSWARNISTMLGYKSDGRVEVVVNMVHKALAIGGDSARGKRTGLLGDPWGGDRDHLVKHIVEAAPAWWKGLIRVSSKWHFLRFTY
uniref:(northern house mosquito) hypothetical protein n=1 Tax=Culex pipiens TaxID=7175 RepID=A0A8D8GLV3_CULPI